MRQRSKFLTAGALVVAAGLLSSPVLAATKTSTKPFIDLQNFAAGEPDFIDPGLTSTLTGAQIAVLMFDSLTDTDAAGALVPAAATKWSTADQGKNWVFTIRKHKFSNGEPVLPSSFVRGWIRATDSKFASEVAYHSYIIDGFQTWNEGKGPKPTSVVADDKKMTLLPERCTETVNVYHVNLQNYREGTRLYGIACVPKREGDAGGAAPAQGSPGGAQGRSGGAEQSDDGALLEERGEPARGLPADVAADAGVLRAVHGAPQHAGPLPC